MEQFLLQFLLFLIGSSFPLPYKTMTKVLLRKNSFSLMIQFEKYSLIHSLDRNSPITPLPCVKILSQNPQPFQPRLFLRPPQTCWHKTTTLPYTKCSPLSVDSEQGPLVLLGWYFYAFSTKLSLITYWSFQAATQLNKMANSQEREVNNSKNNIDLILL